MDDNLETVATFTDLTQAQAARSALKAADISVFLRDENTGSIDWGLMPALGGLRLEVNGEDAERAREVLAELALEPASLGLSQEVQLAGLTPAAVRAGGGRRARSGSR